MSYGYSVQDVRADRARYDHDLRRDDYLAACRRAGFRAKRRGFTVLGPVVWAMLAAFSA